MIGRIYKNLKNLIEDEISINGDMCPRCKKLRMYEENGFKMCFCGYQENTNNFDNFSDGLI